MKITPAGKQDLASAHALEHVLFGHHAYPQFFFRQAFDCWPHGLLIAKEEDQITGYVLMATSDEQNTHWILSLAVDSQHRGCLLYTSPSPRDYTRSRMPSSA